jgi:hypothetical protein
MSESIPVTVESQPAREQSEENLQPMAQFVELLQELGQAGLTPTRLSELRQLVTDHPEQAAAMIAQQFPEIALRMGQGDVGHD